MGAILGAAIGGTAFDSGILFDVNKATLGVAPMRFTIMGYGESQPIASNDTDEGRQLNRRVEVAIYADEKLKDAAIEKTGG